MAEWDVLLWAAIHRAHGNVFYERLLLVSCFGFIKVFFVLLIKV